MPLESVCPVLVSSRRLHNFDFFIVRFALTFSHVTVTATSAFHLLTLLATSAFKLMALLTTTAFI